MATVIMKWLRVMRKKDSRVATLDFRRASFNLFRELFSRVPWESVFEGLEVHKCWSVFKNHLLSTGTGNSTVSKSSKKGRRPAWLNRELLVELKRKKKLYDLWNQGQASQEDYRAVICICKGEDTKGQNSIRVETGQCCVR